MSQRDELAKAARGAHTSALSHKDNPDLVDPWLLVADAVVAHLTSDITDDEIGDAVSWDWLGKIAAVRALLAQQVVTKDAEIERLHAEVDRLNGTVVDTGAERDVAYAKGRADLIAEATSDEAIERVSDAMYSATNGGLYDPMSLARVAVRARVVGDAGFITAALAAAVAFVSVIAACAVSFAAGTNTVETIPVPGPTVTVETPGPVKTVEVTRAPERVSRGEERHVTPRTTAPGASGATSPGRPGGHESTPNTGRPTGLWLALAQCESGADLQRVSKSGKYAGAYQFSTQTWAGFTHGKYGPVLDASWPVQTYVAYRIWIKQGWGAFPGCGTKLGHPVMPKVGKP